MHMPTWIKQMLTEDDDNSVYCPVRVFGVSGGAMFHLFTGYHVISTGTFDPVAYGTGLAAIVAAMATGIGVKSKLGADTENHHDRDVAGK